MPLPPRSRRFAARRDRAVAPPLLPLAVLVIVPAVIAAGLLVGIPPSSGSTSNYRGAGSVSVSILFFHPGECIVPPPPPLFEGAFLGTSCLSVTTFAMVHGGVPPYNFAWNFGDGTGPVFGQSANHTYGHCGVYDVTAQVFSFQGVASNSTTVFVCPSIN